MDSKIHYHVIQRNNMKKEELIKVKGGGTFSAVFINAISRALKTVYDIGVAIGSAIRRATSKNICY